MKMVITTLASVWLLIQPTVGKSQGEGLFWVLFNDSPPSLTDLPSLSPDAIQRRAGNGIRLDRRDFPVSGCLLDSARSLGIRPRVVSRWLNGFSAELSPEQTAMLASRSWVSTIKPVAKTAVAQQESAQCDPSASNGYSDQLALIGLDHLHRLGFSGKGVRIAVFDNGYHRVDHLPEFTHLFAENRIIGGWDFVSDHPALFEPCIHCRHGTQVLSILAGRFPGRFIGAAPDAELLLFRTENDSSETRREEDFWVAAAEMADSMGAQIFTTSLGYFDFDDGFSYAGQLDGQTALISIAAEIAAQKGILVVNSAGNSGGRGLNAPADAPSVLSIGSVNRCGDISGFSSRGPTSDGRIKPDLVAMGERNTFVRTTGELGVGNGTSYSCPLVSGLAACLMQAVPGAPASEIREALIATASHHQNPNNSYGHGIPSGPAALERLTNSPMASPPDGFPYRPAAMLAFPNPSEGQVYLVINPVEWGLAGYSGAWMARLADARGKQVAAFTFETGISASLVAMPPVLNKGLFLLTVYPATSPDLARGLKIIVN